MPTLSSAIVKKGIASMRDVEEALARQVLYGGDLATNLLELSAVSESELISLLGDSYELSPAPVGALPQADGSTLRLLPKDVAHRHAAYPLAENAGVLRVAVSEPLPEDVATDLAFALGVQIEQHVAPLVRIRQAIARDYGVPLDRRMLRLIAKLEGRPDPSPSSLPPKVGGSYRPPSVPPIGFPQVAAISPATPPTPPTPPVATGTQVVASPTPAPKTMPVAAPAPARSATPPLPPPALAPVEQSVSTRPVVAIGSLAPATQAPNTETSPVEDDTLAAAAPERPPSEPAPAEAARLGLDEQVVAGLARSKRMRRGPRRGPYTGAMAEADLTQADSRDAVLTAFFDFAAQFFEYSALFVVQGDIAEGRDSHGPGADRNRITGIGVPLDLPSALSNARDQGSWQLTRLNQEGLDASLSADLGRRGSRVVLLMPIMVRQRCVLILYGDHGKQDVELSEVGDVISFAPLVASALEHVILKKKLGALKTTALKPPAGVGQRRKRGNTPSPEERSAALVRALNVEVPATARATPAAQRRVPGPQNEKVTPPQGTPVRHSSRTSANKAGLARTLLATRQSLKPAPPPLPEASKPKPRPAQHSPAPSSKGARLELVADEPGDANDSPEITVGEIELDDDWNEPVGEAPLAPSSRSVAYAPRRPKPRKDSEELKLPSVIVDIESDCRELVARLVAGDAEAQDKLVEIGEPAFTALVAGFPGPITTELRRGAGDDPPRASQCGPILRTLAKVGAPAVPFLVVRTADVSAEVRSWATRLLGELPGVESARAVVRRTIDKEPAVRRAAVAAGRMLQSDPESRGALRDALLLIAEDRDQPEESRLGVVEALAEVRDVRAIPRLIRLLEDENADLVKSVQWALTVLTRQDFARSPTAWRTWWDKNSDRHRIEWLIDALMHEDAELRRAAGEELKNLTKEYFGYYDDLPKKERVRAQQRYQEWWESKGKARFG